MKDIRDALGTLFNFSAQKSFDVGPELGAAYFKAMFYKIQQANSGHIFNLVVTNEAIAFMTGFKFSWNNQQCPEEYQPHSVIHQCIFTHMLDILLLPVPDETQKWHTTKVDLLKMVFAYNACMSDMTTMYKCMDDNINAMSAFVTFISAALGDNKLEPAAVSKAKQVIAEEFAAVQLKEGLGSAGIGTALQTESDSIVLKGALDDELDGEFRLLMGGLFSDGLPTDQGATRRTGTSRNRPTSRHNGPGAASTR